MENGPLTPRVPKPEVDGSSDTDRLLGAMSKMSKSVDGLVKQVGDFSAEQRGFAVRLQTFERAQSDRDAAVRKEKLVVRDQIREASDADAKLSAEQAAMVIAIDETRKYAKDALTIASKALKKIEETKKTTDSTAIETKAQTEALARVEAEPKPRVPLTLAAVLNLSIGLVYLVLELLRRIGK